MVTDFHIHASLRANFFNHMIFACYDKMIFNNNNNKKNGIFTQKLKFNIEILPSFMHYCVRLQYSCGVLNFLNLLVSVNLRVLNFLNCNFS